MNVVTDEMIRCLEKRVASLEARLTKLEHREPCGDDSQKPSGFNGTWTCEEK